MSAPNVTTKVVYLIQTALCKAPKRIMEGECDIINIKYITICLKYWGIDEVIR